MSEQPGLISNAFQTIVCDAPQHAQAWGGMLQGMAACSVLDKNICALAALLLENGVFFYVWAAMQVRATCKEVIRLILVGLTAAGNAVTQVLPVAAYDAQLTRKL